MSLWEYLWAWPATTKGLYHLNGNSTDSSGNGNNWTDTNVSYVAGKFWQCASFNGSSSYITTSSAVITWNVWAWTTISFRMYWDNYTNCVPINHFSWSNYYSDIFIESTTKIYPRLFSYTWTLSGSYTLQTGKRYHIVMTWSWTTEYCYINWELIFTRTWCTDWTPTWNFTIWRNAHLWWRNYFDWLIDEVIVENRVWTPVEIQKYYTYAKWRFWIQ